jgi:hypothetical protein
MRRRLASVLLSAAAVLPAALLFPAAALAWSPDELITGLSGRYTVQGAAVAVDPDGHATAIWGQAPDAASPSYSVVTADHTLGSFLVGTPIYDGFRAISANGVVTYGSGIDSNGISTMALGAGPGGSAVATWMEGSPVQIEAAARGTSASAWGGAQSLSHTDGVACPANINAPATPALAINDAGNGHIAFMGACPNDAGSNKLVSRAFGPGALAASNTLLSTNASRTEGGSPYQAALAEKPTGGEALTAWEHDLNGTGRGVFVQQFAPGASGDTIDDGHYVQQGSDIASNVRVGYLPGGRQLVVYKVNGVIYVSSGGATPVALVTTGQSPLQLTLAVGADGTAVLGWLDGNSGALWVSVRPPDGTLGVPYAGSFGPATQLSDSDGNPHALRLAVSANGVGYAAWVRDTGLFDGIEASILDPKDPDRSPGAPWTFQPVPDPIVNGGTDQGLQAGPALAPALATDPRGDGIVVAPLMIDTNSPVRYGLVSTEQPSPRRADPAPGDGGGSGDGPAPSGGTTPAPSGGSGGTTPTTTFRPAPRPTLVVSGFNLTRNYFGAASREGRLLARGHEETVIGRQTAQGLRSGTKVLFTLSQAARATVTVTFDGCFDTRLSRRAPARTVHCTRRTRQATVWTKTVRAVKGRNSVTFTGTGLLRRQRLIPGATYDVTVKAIDAGTGIAVQPRAWEIYARADAAL